MTSLRATLIDYERACRARKVAPRTLDWYEQKLNLTLELLAQYGITTTQDLSASALNTVIGDITEGGERSTYTIKGYVQVIKGWLTFLEDEELIGPSINRRIKLPKVEKRLIKTLDTEQQEDLVGAANHEMTKWMVYRDRAIVRLLLDTGIRASELITLLTGNVDIDRDPHIKVFGKGRKEREVGPLSYETCRAIGRYLRNQPRKPDEVLFISRYHRPLTVSGLDQILYRLRDWAGLEGIEVRAHVFRHTFAVTKLREGMDIKRLSLLMGHSSVTTTEVYLRDFDQKEARREARFHERR